MKIIIKEVLRRLIDCAVVVMGKTSSGRYLYSRIIRETMTNTQQAVHHGVTLVFSTPNALNKFRADTFATKEPETLDWIDGIPRGSVVWDVGANVGLYACYAAKARDCRVFAFEPSVFNLELLARNIFLNDLTNLVTIIPLPLSESMAFSKLNMTSTDWGDALSTFGKSYGYDGKPLGKTFEFATIGLSIHDAIELLKIPKPDYVKLDVDGIEHLILKGGAVAFKDVQGVLVEINDDFKQQNEDAARYLSEAGLLLKEKRRWEASVGGAFDAVYNQIWHRAASNRD